MTTTSTEKYAVLINEDRIRATLKRMFSNALGEVLGELLQNSQRAGASRVAINTFLTPAPVDEEGSCIGVDEQGFTYQDNGHGLVNGIDSLHTLLKLADSHFEDSRVDDQHPMGLGFHSLLAWDQVQRVTIESGTVRLVVDAKRWWDDPAHYKGWHERVETIPAVEGLRLVVNTSRSVSDAFHQAFPYDLEKADVTSITQLPAVGYTGVLHVEFNDVPVATAPTKDKGYLPEVLFETTFKGNRLVVGTPHYLHSLHPRSVVNWYGQLVDAGTPVSGIKFYLEVREGRPVNPKTPSRAGLIEDAELAELTAFVKTAVFDWVADAANVELVTPKLVRRLFEIDFDRAARSCPFFVARRLQALSVDGYSSFNDFESPSEKNEDGSASDLALLRFDDPTKTIVRSQVEVYWPSGTYGACYHGYDYGIESFMTALGQEAYVCDSYHVSRMLDDRVLQLRWWPEVAENTAASTGVTVVTGPGSYTLTPANHYNNEKLPFPNNVDNLFVLYQKSFEKIDGVGLVAYAKDPIAFLETFGMVGYLDYRCDADKASYTAGLDTVIRNLLGESVRTAFTTADLLALFPVEDGAPPVAISGVKYHYPRKGDTTTPTHITASTSDGRTRKVRLYGA